jgi:ABC-type glutathione transport system ATPase component
MLVVDGVGKRFRARGRIDETVALSDVSFSVRRGETIAIVGGSGAGKTTLARIIAGLETPTTGNVTVDGEKVAITRRAPSRVQMVFQHPGEALNPWLSVGASIGEPLRKLPGAVRRDRVASMLQAVDLDGSRARHRPREFSGGQLQRVVLARALVSEPDVLLCDEPTSALDVSVQGAIVNLLLRLQAERGFACALVTHDLTVARALADSVLVLSQGRVVEHQAAEDFFAGPASPEGRSLLDADDLDPDQPR